MKFKVVHLLALLTVVAVGLWYLTQHKKSDCVAVVEKYRIVESDRGNFLQIQFRFSEPEEMQGEYDMLINRVPVECFPKAIAPGKRLHFQFQNETTFFAEKEQPMEKFWKTLMHNEANVSPDIMENLVSQILSDFER